MLIVRFFAGDEVYLMHTKEGDVVMGHGYMSLSVSEFSLFE